MTARKRTSPRISSLAAKYINWGNEQFSHEIEFGDAPKLFADVRSMAASLLSQDEVKGGDDAG